MVSGNNRTNVPIAPYHQVVQRNWEACEDVSLEGEGQDRTRIVSSARGAAVVLTAPGTVAIDDLTLTHEGDASASLLLVRSGQMKLGGVHLTGASLGGRSSSDRPDDPLI